MACLVLLTLWLRLQRCGALPPDSSLSALLRRELITDEDAEETQPLATAGAVKDTHWMTLSKSSFQVHPEKISLFCFAWTTRKPAEERLIPEIRQQYAKCDGHQFFTDTEAPGEDAPDIVKVVVPSQENAPFMRKKRDDHAWLYHRNAAGLIPAWTHLLETRIDDTHDWIINSELDHFMRPSQVRRAIGTYLTSLWNGTEENKRSVGKPTLLMFGNAFVFNREMVQEMRRQWSSLSKIQPVSTVASGCPAWFSGPTNTDCSQDEIFPALPSVMQPGVYAHGMYGCGQPARNGLGQFILVGGLACWQMDQSPVGDDGSEKVQLETIRKLANSSQAEQVVLLQRRVAELEKENAELREESEVANQQEVQSQSLLQGVHREQDTLPNRVPVEHYAPAQEWQKRAFTANREAEKWKRQHRKGHGKWQKFYPDKQVPVIHHIKWASVHALARELLGL